MSLFSHERVVVAFSPTQLNALRLKGRFRPKLLEKCSIPVKAVTTPVWDAGIDALEILLDDPAWGDRDTTLVLSSHYVRYAVLPKGEGLGEKERNDLARLIFRNIFGELAHDWEICVSPGGRQPTLASGIPRELLTKLRAICEGRAELTSIQAGLMPVFNRARLTIGKHSGVLALIEPGRITLATLDKGHWQSIISRAGEGSDLAGFLAESIQLPGVASGENPGDVLWLCDLGGNGSLALPPSPPWQITRLSVGPVLGDDTSLADWGGP